MLNLHKYLLVSCSLIGACASAQAQEVESAVIGDIVVTAQKRAENLQDVPIAIAAVGADALKASSTNSLDAISQVAPGVVGIRSSAATNFYLRGIGTASGNAGAESPVATFVDGVYMPSLSGTTLALNNIERIEVLKGPQGTLYGRNATGGAVNVITRTPSFTPGMEAEISYGNLDTIGGNFYGTAGLSETIAADFAFYYNNQRDGFGRNVTTGNDNNRRKDIAFRGKLLWEATDALTFTLAGDYSQNKGPFGVSHRLYPGSVGVDGSTFNLGFWDTQGNIDSYVNTKLYGGSLKAEYEFSSMTLTSISAYRRVEGFLYGDLDMGPLPIFEYPLTERGRQFTQELQLSSAGDGPFQWTVGAFYLDSQGGFSRWQVQGSFIDGLIAANQLPAGTTFLRNRAMMKTKSYSAFGQGTYALSDATNLTVGLRYTRDERAMDATLYLGIDDVPVQVGTVDDQHNSEKPTWRLALDHHFTDDVMAYASYSRGFKSGLYNTSSPADPPVRPEQLDAYEIGFKSKLLGRRLQINGSAFYYDYKDLQVTKIEGSTQRLLNAGKAESYGIELEAQARITPNLSFNGAVNWLHARYKDFEDAPISIPNPAGGNTFRPCTPDDGNADGCAVNGNHMVASPEWTASASINYEQDIGVGMLGLNVGMTYSGSYFFEPDNRVKQKNYALFNGQIKWTAPSGNYYVRAFGSNLTNKKYYAYVTQTDFGDLSQVAPGRTYGIGLGVIF